ncbi:MAG: GNAT family N-acetyltransferase [Pseudomonadota bacterium]
MSFSEAAYFEAIDQTWPAASYYQEQGWVFREGRGGGKRVSAASALDPEASVEFALGQFKRLKERPLFMLRKEDQGIDDKLDALGFAIVEPVDVMSSPLTMIDMDLDIYAHNTPTQSAQEIWAEGGIGDPRLAVMARADCAKSYLQIEDKAVAFVAVWRKIAMVHALEVRKSARRQGLGKKLMQLAMGWAAKEGAAELAILTVKANTPAQQLYRGMGFKDVAHYHYRLSPDV